MTSYTDQAQSVRAGEELDQARLQAYLAQEIPGLTGSLVIEQFPSGFSNLTYLIRMGTTEMVLRRPPFGSKVKSAHDMGREVKILSKLHPVFPQAPKPLVYCEDLAIMDAPFYVMERVPGIILRKDVPAGIGVDVKVMHGICESFIQQLVRLHQLPYDEIGLRDFGKPQGYVQRQVEGWINRFEAAVTENVPMLDQVCAWLRQQKPLESGVALIHNDYKLDNVVLAADNLTRIVGLLDWEMSTLGDPWMDLGTTLSYWIQADDPEPLQKVRMNATVAPGALTRRELVERYGALSGKAVEHVTFYYAFGLLKLAVIAQQIYYRYAKGLTQDKRFAQFNQMVKILVTATSEVIDKDKI